MIINYTKYLHLQSMVDISADEGWLATTLRVMHIVQMCVQGRWISDASILTLPHLRVCHLISLKQVLEKSSLARILNVKELSSLSELLTLHQLDEKLINSAIFKTCEPQHYANQVLYTKCVIANLFVF